MFATSRAQNEEALAKQAHEEKGKPADAASMPQSINALIVLAASAERARAQLETAKTLKKLEDELTVQQERSRKYEAALKQVRHCPHLPPCCALPLIDVVR